MDDRIKEGDNVTILTRMMKSQYRQIPDMSPERSGAEGVLSNKHLK